MKQWRRIRLQRRRWGSCSAANTQQPGLQENFICSICCKESQFSSTSSLFNQTHHWWLNFTDRTEESRPWDLRKRYKQAFKVFPWLNIKRHVIEHLLCSASMQRGSWRKHPELQTWPDGGCLLEALCCQCVSLSWRSSWWRLGVWRCFHTWTHPTRGCWSHWGLFVEVWNLYVELYFCWRLVLLQSVTQRDENNRGSGGTSQTHLRHLVSFDFKSPTTTKTTSHQLHLNMHLHLNLSFRWRWCF